MRNIYFTIINDVFAKQVQLPYAPAMLWTYASTDPTIASSYHLGGFYFIRTTPEEIISEIVDPDVVGLSCYVWNWEFNKKLARLLKETWPDCLVVMGGPQPPNQSATFFQDECPHVDIVVHYEGEETFLEILKERLTAAPNYNTILGCSIRQPDNTTIKTAQRPAIKDPNIIPSPYLTGLMDEYVADKEWTWNAVMESHRGCPYSCTFCELGASFYSKLYRFDDARVKAEIDWFGQNQIEYVVNSDSNFGIFPRDLELAQHMARTKAKYGKPDKLHTDWAKNAAQKVFKIVKVLNDAKMDKGMTLAVQSMNAETLKFIKRTNTDYGKYEQYMKLYNDANIPTYTEMIIGLPGETKGSFVTGICRWLEVGQHRSILLHSAVVLNNTPLGDPDYQQQHGIQWKRTMSSFYHKDVSLPTEETEMVVVGTRVMPHDDWLWCYGFAWIVKCFHFTGGFTQLISRFLREAFGITYHQFYLALYEHARDIPGLIHDQFVATMTELDRTLQGDVPWGRVLPEVNPINCEYDEAAGYHFINSGWEFWDEIGEFLEQFYLSTEMYTQLIEYTELMLKHPTVRYPRVLKFGWNFHDVIFQKKGLVDGVWELMVDNPHYDDIEHFLTQNYWWGRKNGRALVDVVTFTDFTEKSA